MSFQDQKSYCSKAEAEIQKEKGRKGTALMRQVPYQGCVCICECVFVDVCGVKMGDVKTQKWPKVSGLSRKVKNTKSGMFPIGLGQGGGGSLWF